MRENAGIFILICLLFLVGTVGAAVVPDTVIVTTNKPWIIANNVDQSTVTVTVMNTTPSYSGQPLQEATVDLTVSDTYGTLSTTPIFTDSSGKGKTSSNFKVKTKSGAAQITATITSPGLSNSTIQNIDHEVPVKANLQYPFEGEVASNVTFKISIIDRWGNPIDGRNTNENHTITLAIFGPSDDCGFFDSNGVFYPNTLQSTLDINGNRSVQVRLSKIVGDNNIQIASKYTFTEAVIRGISTDVPYRMTGSFAGILHQNRGLLANDEVRANNEDFFILEYFLYDVYGNPVQKRSIGIRTNLTDELTQKYYTTNSLGQIQVKYGPKISILTANITAIANDTAGSVNKTLIVKFVTSDMPTDMVLGITPQTMASLETNPSQTARVVGRVIDPWGNPQIGEEITFKIIPIDTAPYNATRSPSFASESNPIKLSTTKITDEYGNAIVTFYPGKFVEKGNTGHSAEATGKCLVTATWSTPTPPKTISSPLEWKNFPYLSIEINASPQLVHVNETIDVKIKVTGDGYKFGRNPITVVLDMDGSSSLHGSSGGEDRMTNSKVAAKRFANWVITNNSQNQFGLVSYGFEDNEQFHLNTSYHTPLEAENAIQAFNMSGSVMGGIMVNTSVHNAVDQIMHNPLGETPNEVRAIILLGDTTDPGGRWDTEIPGMIKRTWGNVTYGDDGNNIHVYTITYLSSGGGCGQNTSDVKKDMAKFAPYAGGKDYCGENLADLNKIFDEIAETLSALAGTNTTMNLDFSNVPVNSTPMEGGEVFDYVFIGPEHPPQPVINPDSRTSIIWPNATQSVVDQTNNWTAANNYQLKFDIGTIKVKETWEATFRLRVKQEGLIQLFGPGSRLSYNNNTEHMPIPQTWITSFNSSSGFGSGTLDLSNLVVAGTVTDSIPMQWILSYSGFATATESMEYSYNDGPWIQFDTRTNIAPGNYIQIDQLDVKQSPGSYRIKVHALAPDGEDEEILGPITVSEIEAFIKLT